MCSPSLPLLLLALFALVSHAVAIADDADTASRIDLLEQRIEALERLVKSQSSMIEESLQHQRNLLHEPLGSCLPTRNHDNVCVYDHDVKFLYQDAEIVFESSNVEFSFTEINIEDSNTTFSRNPSLPDTSNVVFDSTKISYSHVDASMSGSSSSVTDSYIDYGSNTNVHWHGDTASAYFTDGVDLVVDKSAVVFDDTVFELTGDHGSTLSRVPTHFRGPEDGENPIDVLFTRRINVRFEQTNAVKVSSDMDFEIGSDVLVKDGASLQVNGRLESNDETEFSGHVKMVGVSLDLEGDLFIDGTNGLEHSEIEFGSGVEVRFSNDVSMAQNLDVHGEVETGTLDVSEGATVRGRLSCRKGATISGDTSDSSSSTSMYSSELLRVEGGAKMNRNLQVDGNIKTDNNLDVEGTADIRSLEVTAATKLYSLKVEGGNTNVGPLTVRNRGTIRNLDVENRLTVDGTSVP